MSIYIIRPKQSLLAKSLDLISRKFQPDHRQKQFDEIINLRLENENYQEIYEWTNESQNRGISKILNSADSPGFTGTVVLETSEEEAKQASSDLPDAIILRDRPIGLIHPYKLETFKQEGELTANDLWHLQAIRSSEEKFKRTGKGITIAVLDTGIDSSHPALRGKVTGSFEFDTEQWQVSPTASPIDTEGHGTHVAGLICGQKIGVAPEAELVSGIMIPKGRGMLSNFVLALDWVASQPEIQLVNISAGISGYIPELEDLVDDVLSAGVLPVCAIGNDGRNKNCSPGNYRSVISVGAIDSRRRIASFSGGGTIVVSNQLYQVPQLVAPGVQVFSTIVAGGYQAWNGTSMATPIVSGIAALILEEFPDISATDLIEELLSKCDDLGEPPERQGNGAIKI